MGLLKRIVKRVELESRIALPIARQLPDFLIIGAQKGGTTSLYDYLIQHPGINTAFRKEVHFFDKNYDKGLGWYKAFFPLKTKEGITGEASPFYLYHPLVPQRVKTDLSGTKLIVLLRDPVQRAYSHFKMEKRRGHEKLSFLEALEQESARLSEEKKMLMNGKFSYSHQFFSYLDRGKYAEQLERWFKLFPRNQFLILESESFFKDPKSQYEKVLKFLNVEPYREVKFSALNTDTTKKQIPKEAENYLRNYYEPYNHKLRELMEAQISW